jgi:hypothetical protein
MLEFEQADLDLVETLLTSRSDADALVAYSALRLTLPARAIVMLANLREIILELPSPPFVTGTGLDALERAGYEASGTSYRKLFESDHGMYGVEFLGEGTLCRGIAIATASARLYLHPGVENVLDAQLLAVVVNHNTVLDSLLEGLQLIGYPLEPKIYVSVDDFVREHASAAGAVFGELF